jgi:biopolymer transport protein ExbB/TolQ
MPVEHLLRDPVLIILALGSLVSWALIADCLIVLWKSVNADGRFARGERRPMSPLSCLESEIQKHDGLSRDQALTILDIAIVLERQKLERALPLLGAIGSTAPYLGLLGTVIGIIQAFQAIQAQNNMSPSVVAGGIATALIATAMGLAVAIPAVAAHHLLSSAISRRVAEWESIAAEWLPGDAAEESRHESLPLA